MVGVWRSCVENVNETVVPSMDFLRENSPITKLVGYKLRFLNVDFGQIDELTAKANQHFEVKDAGIFQDVADFYDLIIEVVHEEDRSQCLSGQAKHKEFCKKLSNIFNVYDDLLFIHPVYRIVGWKKNERTAG